MSKWPMVKLEQICSIITDGTHLTPTYCDDGVIFLSSKNVTSGKIDWDEIKYIPLSLHKTLQRDFTPQLNDILLAKNGTTGIAALVDRTNVFSFYVSLALLRPMQTVNPQYLLHLINSPLCKRQFNAHLKGIGVPNLHLGDIRKTEIPLPPLPEQKRIVELLDRAQGLIDRRKGQIALMDTLTQSLFYEMFGDPVKNEMGWEKKALKSCASKIGSGATPRGGDSSYKTEGIPLIRSMNVRMSEFKYANLAFIDDIQARELNNVTVEKCDVLLNITGASVARVCIVPDGIIPARVNQHVSIIRCQQKVSPFYLTHCLLSDSMQKHLWKIAESGATRQAITKQQIEELVIPVPPIADQKKFYISVSKIEETKQRMSASLAELEQTFNALMQESFYD